ncbi:MAG TPA: NAD(P)H-binding protein, partial [Chitinophaga sp.]
MKITLTGSLGNISKPLAIQLIAAGHQVTLISSSADKKADIEALGAKPAIGSITDTDFLTAAFTGAEVVYTMVPPNFAVPDLLQYFTNTGNSYAAAIRRSGVQHVVHLSSMGAHLDPSPGPIAGAREVEAILTGLEDV